MTKPPAEIVARLDGADDETLRATIEYCEAQLDGGDERVDDVDEEADRADDPPEEFEGDEEQWAAAAVPNEWLQSSQTYFGLAGTVETESLPQFGQGG